MNSHVLKKVKLIAYDFDGVMTDNRVVLDSTGKEAVIVNRADGLGVSEIKKMGIEQIIISTESDAVVAKRAQKLGLVCFTSVYDKKGVFEAYLQKRSIRPEEALFVGNDLNDVDAMEFAGVSGAPSDAHPEVKKVATFVMDAKGGDGVIRELFDLLKAERARDA